MTISIPILSTPRAIATDPEIRSAQTRVIDRLSADPEAAKVTIAMTGRVAEGLACVVQQGKFSAVMDMGPAMGGAALGPSPGFFARAAIAGCLSIAIKMTAAREGLNVRAVDVTVETDFDDLAIFGLGTRNAAPTETRISLALDSPEPEPVLEDLTARVLACDPWFLALRDKQRVVTSIAITA